MTLTRIWSSKARKISISKSWTLKTLLYCSMPIWVILRSRSWALSVVSRILKCLFYRLTLLCHSVNLRILVRSKNLMLVTTKLIHFQDLVRYLWNCLIWVIMLLLITRVWLFWNSAKEHSRKSTYCSTPLMMTGRPCSLWQKRCLIWPGWTTSQGRNSPTSKTNKVRQIW